MTYSVFHEVVLQNREVCSHCFRRIREVEPAPDDDYWREHGVRTRNGHSTETLEDISTDRTAEVTPDGRFSWVEAVVDYRGNEPVRRGGGRVVCGGCGRIDGGFGDEAKPKDTLRSDLARACDRVADAEVSLDRDAVFTHFESIAGDPDRQHDQLGILAEAIQVGSLVAAAGTSPTTGTDADAVAEATPR